MASVTDSNNRSVSYSYGSANQLLALTDTFGKQTNYYYDEQGRPFKITKGDGLECDILYDDAGRVSEIADTGNPGGSIYEYQYDANSNITNIYGWSGVESFAYDALNRLTKWTNEQGVATTYAYDAVGNITTKGSKTFTYNAANQITNAGFVYDSNGNLTSDGNLNYSYNSENQLTKVTKVSDGSTVATYTYNFKSLRTSKTTASGTTRYHYDDKGNLVRESDTNNNTIALYIYDNRDQLVAIEKAGAIYYTHTDWRGDILGITDANGNQVATYKYDPWGSLISKTGTFDTPFRYAGYYFDSETGLYYLKARYYSPDQGRFLTKDTFKGFNENPQSLNPYAYREGNPVMNVDPDGHFIMALPFVAYALFLLLSVGIIAYYKWINDPGTQAAISSLGSNLQSRVRSALDWLYSSQSRNIDGWDVRVEQHYGKLHAHWKKGNKQGSCNSNGSPHHKGEDPRPPKR